MRLGNRKLKGFAVTLFALATVAGLYNNCSPISHGSDANVSLQSSVGGGGYDGKISRFAHLGYCAGGIDIASEIQISGDGSAYLIRDNCQALATAVAIAPAELNFVAQTQNVVVFKDQAYDLITGQPHQRVTIDYCRGSANALTVETLIWSTIEISPSQLPIWGQVTLSDDSTSGTLLLTSSNGTDSLTNKFSSLEGQPGTLDLSVPSGLLSYSIQGGPAESLPGSTCSSQPLPTQTMHYAPNSNFAANGDYTPSIAGFNLADVATVTQLSGLPNGVQALIWVNMCNGTDSGFVNLLSPFLGHANIYGFYLMDVPNPSTCPAANLLAESDWIHANFPAGSKVFIILDNQGSSSAPSYTGSYTPANTHIDLFGLNPYPCRSELGGCQMGMIKSYYNAMIAAGIPATAVVPVFQAFGGGSAVDDNGGRYLLPTAAEEQQILATWRALVPQPAFDFAYSWGQQQGNQSLSSTSALQAVFQTHNSSP